MSCREAGGRLAGGWRHSPAAPGSGRQRSDIKNQNRVKLSSNAVFGAQDKTRTCTNVIVHYPLKVACLPISPPGQNQRPALNCANRSANIGRIFEKQKFSAKKNREGRICALLPGCGSAGIKSSRRDGGPTFWISALKRPRGPQPPVHSAAGLAGVRIGLAKVVRAAASRQRRPAVHCRTCVLRRLRPELWDYPAVLFNFEFAASRKPQRSDFSVELFAQRGDEFAHAHDAVDTPGVRTAEGVALLEPPAESVV